MMLVKKLDKRAKIPEKGTPGSIGFDLFSLDEHTIPAGQQRCIGTGIVVIIDSTSNFYCRIAPRSGMSMKRIWINAGVVDSDYRGEIKVIMENRSDEDFTIEKNMKIAQLIVEKTVEIKQIEEVENIEEFDTSRGANGFGSTGV